jgi:hypothetical protein
MLWPLGDRPLSVSSQVSAASLGIERPREAARPVN